MEMASFASSVAIKNEEGFEIACNGRMGNRTRDVRLPSLTRGEAIAAKRFDLIATDDNAGAFALSFR